jgi:hypothetical protein
MEEIYDYFTTNYQVFVDIKHNYANNKKINDACQSIINIFEPKEIEHETNNVFIYCLYRTRNRQAYKVRLTFYLENQLM